MIPPTSTFLGQILSIRRAEASLRVSSVAANAGISPSYYSAIEHGKRIPPTKTLMRVLDSLGVSGVEQLLLRRLAITERGGSPADADLPEEIQALIADIRKAAPTMPPRFIRALRSQIREIT